MNVPHTTEMTTANTIYYKSLQIKHHKSRGAVGACGARVKWGGGGGGIDRVGVWGSYGEGKVM